MSAGPRELDPRDKVRASRNPVSEQGPCPIQL